MSSLCWFILIGFAPLLWVIFSCFFPHLLILPCWLLEILVFTQTFLGFVLGLRSFWVLLLRVKNQSSAQTRANYFHYWGKTFLALYPQPYKLGAFSVWLLGLTALCECQVSSLTLPESSFPRQWAVSSHACIGHYSAGYSAGTLCGSLEFFLCVVFSSLALCLVHSGFVFPKQRSPCWLRGLARFCPGSSSLHHSLEIVSRR